jgi:putative Mg2+ transporter-C (MgtC) family protein
MIVNLLIAAFLGGFIGLEREAGHRPAGLRTTMLVCVGSALFTLLSIHAFPSVGDVSNARVAAQIVSGIGFLGAGTVWRAKDQVKGLTTAATMWVAAALGMAVGAGLGWLALAATLITLFILVVMQRIERRYFPHDAQPGASGQSSS